METPNVLIIPGSPALVRELSPAHGPSRRMAETISELVGSYCAPPIHIVSSRNERWRTERTGSLGAWGAPQVTLKGGNYLPELVARYLLGDPDIAQVREHVTPLDPEALTVVVVDGPAGLTERAPLALVNGAAQAHTELMALLDGAGREGVDKQEVLPGVIEPSLWVELARLDPSSTQLIASDDSLGVGAYVAQWVV